MPHFSAAINPAQGGISYQGARVIIPDAPGSWHRGNYQDKQNLFLTKHTMDKKILDQVADFHRRAFTVDAHFDLTYEVANRRERGQKKIIETSYLQEFRAGGLDLIVSALFIHNFFLPEMGLRRALDQISYLHEEIDESPGQFRLCRTTAEAHAARAAGETGLFLSLEGADPLQNDLQLLRIFYELGVTGTRPGLEPAQLCG